MPHTGPRPRVSLGQQLAELERRIGTAEQHLAAETARITRWAAEGWGTTTEERLERVLRDTLELLRERREQIVRALELE